ncbi:hypothetical protein SBD_5063 [Streptomyces bottropensis ATCC 25435]|uniref:Uncharacterized protein n=1 Tax=Streptomyces bottropensis ATCC 25435 TaxID=1054862 RepID=M3FN41_9ACTN|nr:hypothetical protein SBD_5063 [Streptomyces bottropensis ATCC 25435]
MSMATPCRHLSFRRYELDKGISSCCPVNTRAYESSPRTAPPPHQGGQRSPTPIPPSRGRPSGCTGPDLPIVTP